MPVEYTFDDDKNLTSVKISIPYEIYNYSYEIWTTEESYRVWDYEKEEYVTYYRTERRDYTSDTVKSGNDYYTYTISY